MIKKLKKIIMILIYVKFVRVIAKIIMPIFVKIV